MKGPEDWHTELLDWCRLEHAVHCALAVSSTSRVPVFSQDHEFVTDLFASSGTVDAVYITDWAEGTWLADPVTSSADVFTAVLVSGALNVGYRTGIVTCRRVCCVGLLLDSCIIMDQ